jgi:hypothetical protein
MTKLLGLSLLAAFAANISMALEDSYVYFHNSGSLDFQPASHSIPAQETWGGVYNMFDHLNIQTSNIGSKHKEQSDYFLDGLGPANIVGSDAKSAYPNKLYFAMKGNLSMNVAGVMVTCDNIRLGKATKWWLAGPDCYGGNKGKDPVICICRNGARVKFESRNAEQHHNKFNVMLDSPCGLIDERSGFWQAIAAASGTKIVWSYSASSETFTEEEFKISLTAKYSKAFTFGKLEMSAESSLNFVTHTTQSSSYSQTCEVTVPEGMRLWQWMYSVKNGCGLSTMSLCYFFILPISVGKPCCLVGYQSNVSNVCTEPGKNMRDSEACLNDGTRRLSPMLV